MTTFVRELPFGATLLGDNRVRFRLWAPEQQQVAVEIARGETIAMRRRADGWFEAEADCNSGAQYHYRLGTGLAVPDPASRAQADDVHGASLVQQRVNKKLEGSLYEKPDSAGRSIEQLLNQ